MIKINYNRHFIDAKDINSVVSSLKSDYLTKGPKINEFEKALKIKFKAKYCSLVANGTAALHLTGIALGWKKNDIILSSPITFLAGPNSVVYSNARPDFVDIDEKTYNISIHELEKKILKLKLLKKKIKAVIATDYAGQPCDWKSLRKLANRHKFTLINDNCHSIGAKYFNNLGYAAKYADVVIHSYHAIKNITTGEGGAIFSKNKKFINKINSLKSHGLEKIQSKNGLNSTWPYQMLNLGFNYRITDFQCALGISQLKKLEKFVTKRNQIAKIYRKNLSNIKNLTLPHIEPNISHAYHLFPIKVDFKNIKISKETILRKFRKYNINLQVHYFPVHLQPFYKKKFNFRQNSFPCAENFYKSTLSLPIYYNLKTKEINKIASILKKLIK